MTFLIPNLNWSIIPRWKRPWMLLKCFWTQLTLSKEERNLLEKLLTKS